jgi:hypothetical protein
MNCLVGTTIFWCIFNKACFASSCISLQTSRGVSEISKNVRFKADTKKEAKCRKKKRKGVEHDSGSPKHLHSNPVILLIRGLLPGIRFIHHAFLRCPVGNEANIFLLLAVHLRDIRESLAVPLVVRRADTRVVWQGNQVSRREAHTWLLAASVRLDEAETLEVTVVEVVVAAVEVVVAVTAGTGAALVMAEAVGTGSDVVVAVAAETGPEVVASWGIVPVMW